MLLKRMIILVGLAILLSSCSFMPQERVSFEAKTFKLVYQIRFADKIKVPDNFEIHLVTDKSISSSPYEKATIGKESLIEQIDNIYWDRWRYILVEYDRKYSHGFELDIPTKPEVRGWTEWMKPDFVTKDTKAEFNLCYGKSIDKSSDVPTDAVEMRFKVEK